ncbi:MAG TPA: hypothetical protein VIM70_07945 [Clostridium sp.]|uniref:hypothetical protein n=1 Tax=Clostridium sp. TaxID=1506 RepID=UPI002F957732
MIQNLAYSNTSVKHNKSLFYYISFIIIIIMYFIFFNANSILPDNSTVMNSSLGKEVNAGSTKLSINRWEHNKDKNFMEVELSYKDSGDYIATKLNFSAKAKVNVKQKLAVKTILNTDDIYIVRIENIPENYEAIALKVSQNSSSNSNVSIDPSNITTDDFNSNTADESASNDNNVIKNNSTTIYCDYRKVKINNNLKSETQNDYIINITKSEISNINKEIVSINNNIKNNENLINMANEKITSLNSQYKYEIQEEQTNTNQKINSYKSKIVDSEQQNATLKITKSSLIEKINKLDQKVNDIKKIKDKSNIKTDKVSIKSDNILLKLKKTQEKQLEQLNQIQLKHNTEIKVYQDNYKVFLIYVEKEKHIQQLKKNNLAIQNKKKATKKIAKKAPTKAVEKVVKK